MNNDSGRQNFAVGLDNAQLREDAAESKRLLTDIGDTAEQVGGVMDAAMQMDSKPFTEGLENVKQTAADLTAVLENVPAVDIDFNVTTSALDTAFEQIDRIVDTNEAAIKELEAEYKRLGEAAAAAYKKATPEGDKEMRQMQEQQRVIKQLISERKKVVKAASEEADKLAEVERALKKEAEEAKKAITQHTTLRQQIKAVKEEMAQLALSGIDQNSDAYKRLVAELGCLQDIQGDIQSQGSVMANDENQVAGLLSGLNGLSGAFTAAAGATALFGSESEELQRVMMKLQALMSITMGLQQVQQTLNKDSAFSLVTLTNLRQWWNELLAIGRGEQIADTAATEAATAANAAEAVAKEAVAGASGQAAVAEGADAAGKGANAVAATAGTAANIGLAGAFRMVGAAIKSIPVFGWIAAAIGVLIGVISHFIDKANETSKAVQEKNEMLKESRETYIKAATEVETYQQKIENFNGTQEQEDHLVKELNAKYGEHLGYCKTLGEWKSKLAEKGEAYCELMMKEAEAQAILTKVTNAYVNLLEVKAKAESGEYDHWYNTAAGDRASRQKAISEAEADLNKWRDMYKQKQAEISQYSQANDLGFHVDPSSAVKIKATGRQWDAKEAAATQKKAYEEFAAAVKQYVRDAYDDITEATIDAMQDGQAKEISQAALQTFNRKKAWEDNLRQLALQAQAADKAIFMSKKGATEESYQKSALGQRTVKDYMNALLQNEDVSKQYYAGLAQITEQGEAQIAAIRKKYHDEAVEEFGTTMQKEDLLVEKWMRIINSLPQEFRDAALDQMESEISALRFEDFKKTINWDAVFGDMGKQSMEVLQLNYDKLRQYFEQNKLSMGETEIKDVQEALAKMEDEMANRNPLSAMVKSFQDISKYKTELTDALAAYTQAQRDLTAAQLEYDEAVARQAELQEQVDNGELAEDSEEYRDACDAVTEAQRKKNKAVQNGQQAEKKAMTARNGITSSYKNFASNLSKVGGQVTDVASKGKKLAAVFSDDVADGIEKSISFITDILDAATSVIDAVSDTGKSVIGAMEATATGASQATQGTAQATATAISTVEKASFILTVISAALQVATAIASLFNDDESTQKEIEHLQDRIDQLKWELENQDIMRYTTTEESLARVGAAIAATRQEWLELAAATNNWILIWRANTKKISSDQAALAKTANELATAYGSMSYTLDKALGGKKYEEANEQLKNMAKQQILISEQIDAERSKKNTDNSKIQEWEEQIAELGQQMLDLINEMVEDIIGYTAEDLAAELGDAFVEAFKEGEDAAEAWKEKVDDIVADIIKNMLVQRFLEEPLGAIFDKYKAKWFKDGQWQGWDVIQDSISGFASELNSTVSVFQSAMDSLPDELKQYFMAEDADREASSSGIANASQESVDELNGRITVMQSHTYSLCENMKVMLESVNIIMRSVVNIEANTEGLSTRMVGVEANVKELKNTLNDMALRGIKIK